MSCTTRHLLILLMLLFAITVHASQAPLVLTNDQANYTVGSELGLIQAPPGALTIQTLTASSSTVHFPDSPHAARNLGFTPATIWARLRIQNDSTQSHWWLEGGHPRLQSVMLYQQNDTGDWEAQQLGTRTPVHMRPVKHRANLFPIKLLPGETRTYYLKINTSTSVKLSIEVWTPTAFFEFSERRTIILMLLCGTLLGIGVYYLLMTFVLREALYLYFSLFTLSFLAYFATFSGFTHQYAGSLSADQIMRTLTLSIAVTNFFYLAFSTHFLQTQQFSRTWQQIMSGLMITTFVLMGACLWAENRLASQWVTLISPVNMMTSLGAGLTVMYKGHRSARLFVLSLFIFCLTTTLYTLGVLGYMPRLLNETGMLVTLLGVIPLFAVSFADRYNLLRQENDATQQRILDAERQLTQSLEKQVAERTHELHQAKEQAEAASIAKGEFLAVMSHELRTPMTAVLGAAHLMDKGSLSPENHHLLTTMHNAGQQLLALIDDVLDMSKVEKGELALNNQPFQPEQLLRESVALIRSMADEKGLTLTLNLETLPYQAIGDPVRIRQVLVNLMANAVKYTQQGHISIDAEPLELEGGRLPLLVSVSDTGSGIPPELQSRIFQPFEQIDNTPSRQQSGIGLGLAICQRLIEAMGGTIGVDSHPGQGSRFWFTVDLRPINNVFAELHATLQIPDSLNILLADDTAINREIISKLLRRDGHIVTAVSSGQAVLDTLPKASFDLVLMDIRMPGMDGLQATRKIRQLADRKYATIPVFALTASITQEMVDRCHAAGMAGWVSKPLRLQELYRSLAQYRNGLHTRGIQHTSSPAAESADSPLSLTPEEQQELHHKLSTSLQKNDRDLRDAMAASDLVAMAHAAHKLASCAGMMGRNDLMNHARQLESAAEQEETEQAAMLYERYQAAYQATGPISDTARA